MTDDELGVLLIEDNPGDVRLIEELLSESETLLQRFENGAESMDTLHIHHEETLAAGLDSVSEDEVDVILLDLGLPDSTGLDTISVVAAATEFVPIIVFTGLNDETMGIKAIQQGAQDYLVKDEVSSDLLVRSVHYALERNRQERARARRREQLETLNQLNQISQDITHAVITTSTREELERAVCDRLVESDAYRFAWIGELNRGEDSIIPRVTAGTEDGYLDDVDISIDSEAESVGPTGTAILTQEVQVMQNIQTDPAYEPWRDEAIQRGYRASAAIPILHEELLYGVLNVYASSESAFSDPETEILTRLGDVIGHAISAIERKEALVSDTALELEFETDGIASELLAITADSDSSITVRDLIQAKDSVVAYGTVDDIPKDQFTDALQEISLITEHRILSAENGSFEFEVSLSSLNSLVRGIAAHGGQITSATISDGSLRFVVEFPPGRDKRQLIGLVEEHCPSARNRAQRIVERTGTNAARAHSIFQNKLTEKQRTALQTAYSGGLFDWPRKSTGEELADRLGIAPPTFHQHLRAAEQEFFDGVFNREIENDSSQHPR